MASSDAELVQRCLQGDNAGFDDLVRAYQKPVYCFCYRMLGNADEAADAAQVSFLKAYGALDRFRQDSSFLTWVMKIASNTCIDRSRAWSRHPNKPLEEIAETMIAADDPSPEDSAMQSETERIVREAILQLPEHRRAALVMFYYNGLGVGEISAVLCRPENTIKSDLRIAREMLRRKLEGIVVSV